MIGIIGIEYDEFDQNSYRGVRVSIPGHFPDDVINTGDICADFDTAVKSMNTVGVTDFALSSSFDSFLMDGDKYRWDDENAQIVLNQ